MDRVEVNRLGRRPDAAPEFVDQLTPWRRMQFNAQLTAWQAGCAYVAAANRAALYGLPVPAEARLWWETARARWQAFVALNADDGEETESAYRAIRTARAREDYL